MRNPAKSVRRLTQLAAVGRKIAALESHPQVLQVAANYGNPDNVFDAELLRLWWQTLKDHLVKIQDKPMPMGVYLPLGLGSLGVVGGGSERPGWVPARLHEAGCAFRHGGTDPAQ